MLELNVKSRSLRGRRVARLRKEGLLPGVVYGPGIESFPVEVSYRTFAKTYEEAGLGTLVNLKVEGSGEENNPGEGIPVLIHEPSRDVLTEKFIHVDFYKVRLDKPIRISLPLEFEGEAPAAEESGGTLVKNAYEVEVEGLPLELPKEITVDVSSLKTFEDKILVRDIPLPEHIAILEDPEQVVAFVEAPRTQEELEALEAKPEETIEAVEVEGEKERGERVEEKEGEKSAEGNKEESS